MLQCMIACPCLPLCACLPGCPVALVTWPTRITSITWVHSIHIHTTASHSQQQHSYTQISYTLPRRVSKSDSLPLGPYRIAATAGPHLARNTRDGVNMSSSAFKTEHSFGEKLILHRHILYMLILLLLSVMQRNVKQVRQYTTRDTHACHHRWTRDWSRSWSTSRTDTDTFYLVARRGRPDSPGESSHRRPRRTHCRARAPHNKAAAWPKVAKADVRREAVC